MIESELGKAKRLSVSSRIQATTEIGEVVKFKAIYKGAPCIIYTPPGLSYFGLEKYINNIKSAEEITFSPRVIKQFKNDNTTLEKYIEKKGLQYINDTKANTHSNKIEQSYLLILIKEKAMELSFEKTIKPKKAQQ